MSASVTSGRGNSLGLGESTLPLGEQDIVMIHEAPNLREAVRTSVKLRNIPRIEDAQTMVCVDIEEFLESQSSKGSFSSMQA